MHTTFVTYDQIIKIGNYFFLHKKLSFTWDIKLECS
jgi:hypothetical protein